MRVLSIDVGVKNLGVCELELDPDTQELEIGVWKVMGGSGQADGGIQGAISGAVESMLALYEGGGRSGWDCVVIENQPCIKNPRMKAVQIAIHTFLVVHFGPDVNVCLAGAVGKNNVADRILPAGPDAAAETSGQKYRRTKKRAIEATRLYLSGDDRHAARLAALAASPKKDDLCDSFLQGLYYLGCKRKLLTLMGKVEKGEKKTCRPDAPATRGERPGAAAAAAEKA